MSELEPERIKKEMVVTGERSDDGSRPPLSCVVALFVVLLSS